MGNREWGMAKAIRPLPPHPDFMGNGESAPRFPIPDSPFPRGGGGAMGRALFPLPHYLYLAVHESGRATPNRHADDSPRPVARSPASLSPQRLGRRFRSDVHAPARRTMARPAVGG